MPQLKDNQKETKVLKELKPLQLKELVDQDKAIIVDVREAAEYGAEHIKGALASPLSAFNAGALCPDGNRQVVLHCESGNRSKQAAAILHSLGWETVYHLQGGIQAWRKAGYATEGATVGMPIMRQVQIAAGSLVLLGLFLSFAFNQYWKIITIFVGAGLVFAGTTGWCGMAMFLQKMPWNKIEGK